jgi:hypothetical protein
MRDCTWRCVIKAQPEVAEVRNVDRPDQV